MNEHVRRFKVEKNNLPDDKKDEETHFALKRFKGKLSMLGPIDIKISSKIIVSKKGYRKKLVNRWHLYVFLSKNTRLVFYRKHRIIKKLKISEPNIIQKIADKCTCCKK